ncbi:replication regulatory protein RepA [Erwinia sp. S43]|uniref:replication regulatory protein RepA n=1 Tax=Erwinia sp. S43 TaxID=2769339 RepID=UPI00190A445C|nr:replication regulatory protein RepA [Erwinia sp. S43]MBK0035847.1 replication regulatory protein RepA [Erwinia sp. S43]
MSQTAKTESSSTAKRIYRKGNPLSGAEKQRRSVARKKETHTELYVFIHKAHKAGFQKLCEEHGLTQARMIERLIEEELAKKADPEVE